MREEAGRGTGKEETGMKEDERGGWCRYLGLYNETHTHTITNTHTHTRWSRLVPELSQMSSGYLKMVPDGSRWLQDGTQMENLFAGISESTLKLQQSAICIQPLQPFAVSRWLQDGHPAACQRLATELLGGVHCASHVSGNTDCPDSPTPTRPQPEANT